MVSAIKDRLPPMISPSAIPPLMVSISSPFGFLILPINLPSIIKLYKLLFEKSLKPPIKSEDNIGP